jgi:DNA-binding GntR family transcriptional regulator
MGDQELPALSERVCHDLANRIRTCEIRPGQMIFEAEPAGHYRVSKTPVREALQRLIEEGLVEKYAAPAVL